MKSTALKGEFLFFRSREQKIASENRSSTPKDDKRGDPDEVDEGGNVENGRPASGQF